MYNISSQHVFFLLPEKNLITVGVGTRNTKKSKTKKVNPPKRDSILGAISRSHACYDRICRLDEGGKVTENYGTLACHNASKDYRHHYSQWYIKTKTCRTGEINKTFTTRASPAMGRNRDEESGKPGKASFFPTITTSFYSDSSPRRRRQGETGWSRN